MDAKKKLVIAIIKQAILDLGMEGAVAYEEDRGYSYRRGEALNWLRGEGTEILVKFGLARPMIERGLKEPDVLLKNLEELESAT